MKKHILSLFNTTLKELSYPVSITDLDTPARMEWGDYASSIPLQLSKRVGKPPMEIAEAIALHFPKDALVEKVEIQRPGFVNVWIARSHLLGNLSKLVSEGIANPVTASNGKKVMIEYTDPNPFKEFHIGHLYSNIVGESISRLKEAGGAEVKRAIYQGDVGMHVAKSLWGMKKKMQTDGVDLAKLDTYPVHRQVHFLGTAYAIGATAFEDSEQAKHEITAINKQVYGHDPAIWQLYEKGRAWSLAYFETIYKRLGNNNGKGSFDLYFFESEVGKTGLEIVKEFVGKGIFEKSEGAVIFPGKKHGLHDRVFVNSLGLPTYEAKELGLAPTKYDRFPYDESIIVTGKEINEYFKVLLKALSFIRPDLAAKTTHIGHGMVRLPEGKMSSRTGNIVTGEWLLDETKKHLTPIVEKSVKVNKAQMTEVTETIALAALKYSFLRTNIGKDVVFDFKESLSFEGNSGPYLLYTYARCRSVLKKAPSENTAAYPAGLEPEEIRILRLLVRFHEVVELASVHLTPHSVCGYLYDIAQAFNFFYGKHPILKGKPEIQSFRLDLTRATSSVLSRGLSLLGIQTVDSM